MQLGRRGLCWGVRWRPHKFRFIVKPAEVSGRLTHLPGNPILFNFFIPPLSVLRLPQLICFGQSCQRVPPRSQQNYSVNSFTDIYSPSNGLYLHIEAKYTIKYFSFQVQYYIFSSDLFEL